MKKVLQGTYVMELLRLLVRGLRNPAKATLHIFKVLDNKLGITEVGRVSEGGQRIVVKDFLKAKTSKDFSTLAHVQRYEWCLSLKGRHNSARRRMWKWLWDSLPCQKC